MKDASDSASTSDCTRRIAHLAGVPPELKFRSVSLKVFRRDIVVRSVQAALELRKE